MKLAPLKLAPIAFALLALVAAACDEPQKVDPLFSGGPRPPASGSAVFMNTALIWSLETTCAPIAAAPASTSPQPRRDSMKAPNWLTLASASASDTPSGKLIEICLRLRTASLGSAISTWRLLIR